MLSCHSWPPIHIIGRDTPSLRRELARVNATADIHFVAPIYVAGNELQVGLTLAHQAVWRKISASGGPGVVLEDDAVFHDDFCALLPTYWHRVPPDFGLIYLGAIARPDGIYQQDPARDVVRNAGSATVRTYIGLTLTPCK